MTSDRDRLIEFVKDSLKRHIGKSCNLAENITDDLLANGVIVLPCQKGAVLNRNGEKCIANHWNIILTTFNENNQVRLFDVKEAEQALKGGEER